MGKLFSPTHLLDSCVSTRCDSLEQAYIGELDELASMRNLEVLQDCLDSTSPACVLLARDCMRKVAGLTGIASVSADEMDIWLFSGHGDDFREIVKCVGALCGCRAGYYQFVIDSRFLSCSYSILFATEDNRKHFPICHIISNNLYLAPIS